MNPLIQCKRTILPLFIAGVLACFGLLPKSLAVVPPPDGGYPGFNTAEGQNALFSLDTGVANTAVGWASLSMLTTGSFNTATGAGALLRNTANENTAFGAVALLVNSTGIKNTAVGTSALLNSNLGSFNTAVGAGAGQGVTTASNVICIGAIGANVENSCYIGNIHGATIDPATAGAVFIDANNKVGTSTSSKRFKEDIKPMDQASQALFSLKPVAFRYKKEIDPAGASQLGLVAEDVEKVNPDLVVHDKEGKPYSVRYDQVNAMLLNEFLKEHRKVEKQEATIAQLKRDFQSRFARQQKQIEALTAGLQKVSAQLELSGPAPQVVNNP